MGLLDTYEAMQKEAAAQEVKSQRRDMLTKYASAAEELLEKEYGEDYKATDVENLAEKLIELDVETVENQQKTAEYVEAGQVMAKAFVKELKDKKPKE
jgi:ribosomal protein L17